MPDEAAQEDREAREQRIVRNVRLGLAIPFSILLVIFLIAGLYSFVGPTTPTENKDFVQAVGVLVAGIAGVVGLIFTWRNLRLTRENTDRQLQVAREGQERTQESNRQTLRITEQGQITERFTRAIDQLGETDDKGKPKVEIRLGGVYALERIAKDSPGRDYSTVMEVLTAYARENAPYDLYSEAEGEAEQQEGGELAKADGPQKPASPQEHRAAIRAITDVIRRLHGKDGVPWQLVARLNLSSTNLQGANLQGANLQGANLQGANLQRAFLQEAILHGASLPGANLQRAFLRGAHLYTANLQRADLREANLQRADLQRADLRGAFLQEAILHGASLQGANLQRAFLQEAILDGASLPGAFLHEAILHGAVLQEANLQGAVLQGAVLQEANLQGANLQRAFLPKANLQGANLQGVNGLTQEDLEQTFGDEYTKLPEGFERPKWWIKSQDKQADENE